MAATDQGWDVDEQVLTLQKAAASQPPREGGLEGRFPAAASGAAQGPSPATRRPSWTPEPSPVRLLADMSDPGALIDLLHARATVLEAAKDKVGIARIQIELAIASETILGDEQRATAHAEAAVKVNPTSSAAHSLLRRMKHGRAALPAMLDARRARDRGGDDRRAQGRAARRQGPAAAGARQSRARRAWRRGSSRSRMAPTHAGGAQGPRSGARGARDGARRDAARVGGALDAPGADGRGLRDRGAARGVVARRARAGARTAPRARRHRARRARARRAARSRNRAGPRRAREARRRAGRLGRAREAPRRGGDDRDERPARRAARARGGRDRRLAPGRPSRGRARCSSARPRRAPTAPSVDRRALDELVRLNELDSRWVDAARARRARLRFVTDPAAITYELRALARRAAEDDGDLDAAIADVQRALAVDASDPTLVESARSPAVGRGQARAADRDVAARGRADRGRRALRARALERAARICVEVGRPADAIRHLRSAWIAGPGRRRDPRRASRASSRPRARPPRRPAAEVRALVELYAQAAEQAQDDGRKTAYLEKIALLWEELLGDPARAARAYEQVLAIRRRSTQRDPRPPAHGGAKRRHADPGARAPRRGPPQRATARPGSRCRPRAASAFAQQRPGARAAARAGRARRMILRTSPRGRSRCASKRTSGRWELAAKSLRATDRSHAGHAREGVSVDRPGADAARAPARPDGRPRVARAGPRARPGASRFRPRRLPACVEDHGDPRSLREAIERLAKHAAHARGAGAAHRARRGARRALPGDDANAMRAYRRALDETPDDELLAARLARVAARRARQGHGGRAARPRGAHRQAHRARRARGGAGR